MKVSYDKLQTFFDQPLPEVTDLCQGIIFHAFEVEGLYKSELNDDTILDIKILPDRAYDCKDEAGIAKEVSVIFNLPLKSVNEEKGDRTVSVSLTLINSRLGVGVSKEEVLAIFTRLGLSPTETDGLVICSIPSSRPDITLPEHLIKEAGRIYGYDKISPVQLSVGNKVEDAENFLKAQTVRAKLLSLGFSEIYGYSFAEKGDLQVLKPVQQDKPFLRTNLIEDLISRAEFNLKNILFDDQTIRLFEIGTVFNGEREDLVVGFVAMNTKSKYFKGAEISGKVLNELNIFSGYKEKVGDNYWVIELPLSLIAIDLESSGKLENYFNDTNYQKFSLFPYIIRDIALFVLEGIQPEKVAEIIEKNAGELLVRGPVLFDQFSKEGRTSLAFRLVFQAFDRTLTDEEIGPIMDRVITALEGANFEVRK